jgi:mannosyltransferase OCH1-like enzyme
MIPKIIHLVWLGGERPSKFDYLLTEIKRINDDYEVIEWNDSNIDFELINRKVFDECENLGAKSDILRFEVLYRYGGIYLDYDFLQLKKFDDILDCDFFAGAHKSCSDEVWNSIVGAVKNHYICKDFLDGIKNITSPIKRHEIDRVMNETGPYYLESVFNKYRNNDRVHIFVGKKFFPFHPVNRFLISDLSMNSLEIAKQSATEETICIHLHTTTWQ